MKITIDNRTVEIKEGKNVLDAAEEQGIYIPHLCAHPELTPYGGCRLCCVEVEGMRGYPTACTTQATEGMIVRTHTKTLMEMRREVLQLILSEHPSGCLVCEEDCSDFMGTIRKVGTTTGCRWCPEDGDCELKQVVEHLDLKEIEFPVWYRELPIEKYDPFFDRDYNLCIYCGRCVRICGQFRKSSVLALKQRGRQTTIGPPFDQSHIDADCEFCGACVSVCPTGAMSEKQRKWSGAAQTYARSHCPLCSLNCEIQAAIRGNTVVGTLPPGDPHRAGGELCVKGRFVLPELVNYPGRLTEPRFRFPEGEGIVSWDGALEKLAEQLETVKGGRTALYISPYLTLEEMAAAQVFARDVLETPHITSSALVPGMSAYLTMARASIPLKSLQNASIIVSLFLDGNYNYGPLTLAIKRAADNGVPYYQSGWCKDTTSRFAARRFVPPPGKEKELVDGMLTMFQTGKSENEGIEEMLKIIQDTMSPVFIIGPGILDLHNGADILKTLAVLVEETGSEVFMPNPYGNLEGLMSLVETKTRREVDLLVEKGKIDLLYLVGDAPFSQRPPVKCIVHQAPFPPPYELQTEFKLPTPMWGEVTGTLAGMGGRGKKKIKPLVKPRDTVLFNREIFYRTAKALKKDAKLSKKEIVALASAPLAPLILDEKLNPGSGRKAPPTPKKSAYLLVQQVNPHRYQNTSISSRSTGMAQVAPEDTLLLHPRDAGKLELENGGTATVSAGGVKKTYPVRFRKNIAPGVIHLAPSSGEFPFGANPIPVQLKAEPKESAPKN